MTRARRIPERGVLISIGSNLENPIEQVKSALRALEKRAERDFKTSSLWKTSPVDCPPGSPPFVNAAASMIVRPEETPESLLAFLQKLERVHGREVKRETNEPRPLDLDLIVFGEETLDRRELQLPHPRAASRRFVLEPASEIAADWILPGTGRSVDELKRRLVSSERLERVSIET